MQPDNETILPQIQDEFIKFLTKAIIDLSLAFESDPKNYISVLQLIIIGEDIMPIIDKTLAELQDAKLPLTKSQAANIKNINTVMWQLSNLVRKNLPKVQKLDFIGGRILNELDLEALSQAIKAALVTQINIILEKNPAILEEPTKESYKT